MSAPAPEPASSLTDWSQRWERGRRPLGLRVQILVGLGLVTGFAMLSTGYLALWAAGQSVVGQRESAARAVAGGLAAAVAALIDPARPLDDEVNKAGLRAALMPLEGKAELSGVDVIAPDKRVVLSRPTRSAGDVDPPAVLGVFSGVGPFLDYRPSLTGGGTELAAYAPIVRGGRVLGAVRILQPAPDPLATVLGRSGTVLLALAFADALLVLGLGFFVLTRLVVRPLQAMESATARVTAGDWEQNIETTGPREVAALARSLNQMTASLASQREQLIRTEKLASVGQLAAGVAHEIGNPLAAVLGYVDILRSDAAESAPGARPLLDASERRDTLDRVKAETQRIHRIIQDLLAYSRPTVEEPQPTAPGKLLRSSEALLRPQARFRGVTVTAIPDEAAWPAVLASPGRLTQVFVNLLINAADAMNANGTVTVTCRRVGQDVRLEFHDQGSGIPADLERKVFDPFFTTKDPGQGTGLGLSISQSIIEAFHGTLVLAPSDPATPGATFVITLPAADAAV